MAELTTLLTLAKDLEWPIAKLSSPLPIYTGSKALMRQRFVPHNRPPNDKERSRTGCAGNSGGGEPGGR